MVSTAQVAPRLDGQPSRDGFRVLLAGGPQAAGHARAAVTRLRSDLDDLMVENLRLLVSELVTNSVRHAAAKRIELVVVVAADGVRVEVENAGAKFLPAPAPAGTERESGWGLFLVDHLSTTWGILDEDGGTRVWFELARA